MSPTPRAYTYTQIIKNNKTLKRRRKGRCGQAWYPLLRTFLCSVRVRLPDRSLTVYSDRAKLPTNFLVTTAEQQCFLGEGAVWSPGLTPPSCDQLQRPSQPKHVTSPPAQRRFAHLLLHKCFFSRKPEGCFSLDHIQPIFPNRYYLRNWPSCLKRKLMCQVRQSKRFPAIDASSFCSLEPNKILIINL